MMRTVKTFLLAAGLLSFALICPLYQPILACANDKTNTEFVGDVIHIALPVIAFGSTFFAGAPNGSKWDREGSYQALKSIGTAVIVTDLWKGGASKLRPNERNRGSFPSGHSSFAFAGAGFIDTRYGHMLGVPALLGAAYVAYSRVYADAHFADDVTAGASVGLMSSWLFATPKSEAGNIALLPMRPDGGFGILLTMTDTRGKADPGSVPPTKSRPRFRYEFGFGPAYLEKNEITAPSGTGITFDLDNFNKDEDPTTTAAINVNIFLDNRNDLTIYWAPFESRDRGTFGTPVNFGGRTFPANTQLRSAWRSYDVRARWRYELIPADPWDLKVGGGFFFQDIEAELATETGGMATQVEDKVLLPFVHVSVGYQIAPRWSVFFDVDGIRLSDDYMLDVIGAVKYQLSRRWDLSVGYQYYAREIDTDEIRNRVIYNVPYLSIAYSWF